MKFKELPLEGAYLIDLDLIEDERGFFSRLFCSSEFENHGINPNILQANNSYSSEKGALRGMHYQLPPKAETKLVRCILGSIYDVILDLRPTSVTYGQSYGTTLSADNRQMMYVPKGFAHGFITLSEQSEIIYFVSETYSSELERGIRWDDPTFSIKWPCNPKVLSEKDRNHPNFNPEYHLNTVLCEA
jgi:dTDP-4-dehydrorhamnose 3,5-epimerase